MPAITTKEIAWLAGLLEGEGYFCISGSRLMIAVRMTDRDIITKVANLFGSQVQFKRKATSTYKSVWCAEAYGDRAISWAMTLYSLMGERRKKKIIEMIKVWTDRNRSKASYSKGRLRYASSF